MINSFILIPVMVSFLLTLFLIPFWIRKARSIGLVWEDMNKYAKTKVAGSGGLMVVLGFVFGVLVFVAYRVFIFKTDLFLIEILALLVVVLLLSGIGLVDDLLGWRKGGLRKKIDLFLLLLLQFP